ncbi:MAG TPA: hypothetical protein VKB31_06420 [Trueperaceae bacterium]|nr:hypothetical protein [Trueperaceae bacterium]
MPLRTRLGLVVAAALLALPVAAAQTATTAPTPPGAQRQHLAALQREAARLTLIARLPQADRAEATKLLDRADTLRRRARTLRIDELKAYVAALEAGTAPAAARVEAQQKVSDQRLALARQAATLRGDVQAFVRKVPQARALLRELAAGMGAARGHRFGARPGAGNGTGPGAGRIPAPGANGPAAKRPGRFGSGTAMGGPGSMGRRQAGAGAAPYGMTPYRGMPYRGMRDGMMPWRGGWGTPWDARPGRNHRWMGGPGPWDGMGWDGMGWDGMTWNGMPGGGMPWNGGPWRRQPGNGMPGRNGSQPNAAPQTGAPQTTTP